MAMASQSIPISLFSSNPKPMDPCSSPFLNPNHIKILLQSCSNIRDFSPIHAHLITTNLITDHELTPFVLRSLLSINELDYAHHIFSNGFEEETVIWNLLLETQLKEGLFKEVFNIYSHMVSHGVLLNLSAFHFLIHASCGNFDVKRGSEVHGRILKSGFGANKSLNNNLMAMYSKCSKFDAVRQLFVKLRHRDVISWNTMISCYFSMGLYGEALALFDEMIADGVKPDEITMISLVSVCTKSRDIDTGKKLHIYMEDNDLKISGNLLNCLIDMYVKCSEMDEALGLLSRYHESEVDVVLWTTLISGYVKDCKMHEARCLFDKMAVRNLISWTTMISGYVRCGSYSDSLQLFGQMMSEHVCPDEVVLVTALSACVHVEDYELGEAIHGLVLRCGMSVDGLLGNALLDLYAKWEKLHEANVIFEQLPCKSIISWNSMLDGFSRSAYVTEAISFFDNMPEKDTVSWNTMINFYVKRGMFAESFELFQEMQSSNVKADRVTLISLLASCAGTGALNHGIWLHVYIEKSNIGLDTMLATALIDMYGKCGCSEMAYQLFSQLTERNVFVWTAMISAYAMEGKAHKAIEVYLDMEQKGIKPDYITYIALLSACSHGGLVDEAFKHFNKMQTFYNIRPQIQHYGCMVDLLGRTGRFKEAVKLIETMPVKPDVCIWSSLMRACADHQNVELAEFAFQHLIATDPLDHGAYVLLSNIYAKAGRWDDMSRVRLKLHEMGSNKQPGLSRIEQNRVLYEFTSGGFSNPKSTEIYKKLEDIEKKLVKHEAQGGSSQHSERLAVAFGLINSDEKSKSTIRVVNNVRMCGACHSFMQLLSTAYGREIVIRDNYRFHRFVDGNCSCKDCW